MNSLVVRREKGQVLSDTELGMDRSRSQSGRCGQLLARVQDEGLAPVERLPSQGRGFPHRREAETFFKTGSGLALAHPNPELESH